MLTPLLRVKDFSRTTLKPRHRPLVGALAEAYFAYEGPLDGARLTAFVEDVDRAISNASKTLRFGLVVMLEVVRFAPLFIVGKWALFEELALADRVRMLEKMERSNIALLTLVFVAWKTLMTMIFFEEEAELVALGYPGPERARYKLGLVKDLSP